MDFSKLSRTELKRRLGSMSQVAYVRESVLSDGKSCGMRVADIHTGSGLSFTVVPERGMDIMHASFKGIPLSIMGANGYCHPSYHNPVGLGWLKNWGGGLMTGCGLINAGAPDQSQNLPLHGFLSNTPAENISCRQEWAGDKYVLSISGEVREAKFFGENLLLKRTISTSLGSSSIEITDLVKNEGFKPTPLMLLYHINLGFPLLSENSVIKTKKHNVVPRDDIAAKGINAWDKFSGPLKNFKEQCFYHDIPVDRDGFAKCTLSNEKLGLDFEVAYRKKELPFLTEWKMTGESEYVVGLEPANCHVEGQAAEKDKFKTLKILQPDESAEFKVKMTVIEK